jgi:uncharacterized membrane protein
MNYRDISKPFSWLVLVGGIFGLAASAALTIEKIFLLQNPNYKLSCSCYRSGFSIWFRK